jgi:L-cysteine S-thiosulfotransferase
MKTGLCSVVGVVAALVSPAFGQPAQPLPPPLPGTLPLRGTDIAIQSGIPTIPLPLMQRRGNATEGEQVVVNRRLGNCLSCHEIGALKNEPFHGEIGPSLDGVAGRWDVAALRMIVVDPKKVFGVETVMPAFYRIDGLNRVRPEFAGKPILSAQQVEDVVAFLATMK